MEQLKPCPFCGASAFVWHTNYHTYIQCENYNSLDDNQHMVEVAGQTDEEAIEAWNRRVDNGQNT